jgi:hypothetical protein
MKKNLLLIVQQLITAIRSLSLSLSCMCWHVFSLTKLLIFLIYHFMSHRLEAFPAQFIWVVGQRTDVLPDVILWTGQYQDL